MYRWYAKSGRQGTSTFAVSPVAREQRRGCVVTAYVCGRGGIFAPGQRMNPRQRAATSAARLMPSAAATSPSRSHSGSPSWNDRGGVLRRSAATLCTVTSRSPAFNVDHLVGLRATCNSASLSPVMLHVADKPSTQATCSDYACLNAISHESLCTCLCGGSGHGHAHRPGRQAARKALQARYVQPGFTAAMLAAADSDEAF